MNNELTIIDQSNNTIIETVPLENSPAAIYLSGLSLSSRYTTYLDLVSIVRLFGSDNPFTFNWSVLRFQHTQAIRSSLTELISDRTGKPLSIGTINHKLSAIRGVMKTSWRLGQISSEDFYRAIDISNVKGETILTCPCSLYQMLS